MQKRSLLAAFCCVCSCFFLTTCGLDEYYVLEGPQDPANHLSYYSTDEPLNWYCDFTTNESANSDYYPSKNAGFVFLGTGIYYKIYNSTTTLSSHRSAISSLNVESNYSAAATRMIESYGYQQLEAHYRVGGTNRTMGWSPFVECAERNQRIRLRLKDYTAGTSYFYRATIAFNGRYWGYTTPGSITTFAHDDITDIWTDTAGNTVDYDAITFVVPYRNGGEYSFDFFNDADDQSSSTPNREPQEGDADYQYTSGTETSTYYVQLYAVAIGRDTNYTTSYSLVLDLGTIPIGKE